MNKKNLNLWKTGIFYAFCCFIALMVIQGCDNDPGLESEPEPEPENPFQEINDWIFENMAIFYYWNTQMNADADKQLNPDEYFESLLYSGDKYSWIQDNFQELMASLMGVNTEAGYDFGLMLMSANSSQIIGYITYIKQGTPAEAVGLKRGDFFLTINNTQLTLDNYHTLIREMSNPHTLGVLNLE